MALNSVNTNGSALEALRSLNASSGQLATIQSRISTGLKVSGPTDNGAVWAIAQGERSNLGALDAVQDSLNRNISVTDVAVSAGETISDLLNQAKAKVLAGTDQSLDPASTAALNSDFQSIVAQISAIVSGAEFDGANLISGGRFAYLPPTSPPIVGSATLISASLSSTTVFLGSATAVFSGGESNLRVGGPNIIFSAGANFTSAATASAVLSLVNTSISRTNLVVAKLGSSASGLQMQLDAAQAKQQVLAAGIGNLVDADVASDSAQLTALEARRQLSEQALSIANASPRSLLSLFAANSNDGSLTSRPQTNGPANSSNPSALAGQLYSRGAAAV